MQALVHDNEVVDLAPEAFDVHPAMAWMDAPEGCAVGWLCIDGQIVPPPPPPAPSWDDVRAHRAALLTACDWTQLPDTPLNDETRAAWQAYRQALRDITAWYDTPAAIVWPLPPST